MPLEDFFSTSQNCWLPGFVFPFPDPMAFAMNAFLFSWDHMELYALPLSPAIKRLLSKLWSLQETYVILIALFWLSKGWFSNLLQATVDTSRFLPMCPHLLWQPHFHRFHNSLHMLQLTAWKLSSNSSTLRAIPGVVLFLVRSLR